MVNTRTGGVVNEPERIRRRREVVNSELEMNPPNPPHVGLEAFFAAQIQLLQQMSNTMANMQGQFNNNQQHQLPPREKHREFMSHKPPTFSSSPNPLQADDWLKSVEKMLNIAQCTDREKVLYASGHLIGPTADWWDAYRAAHAAVDTISWAKDISVVLMVMSGSNPHMSNLWN
jgi:hypothetical protein